MNKIELMEKHFPDFAKLLDNAEYNSKQDITEYYGKEVIMIYNGHGGYGWNYRTLKGEYENDNRYLLLERDNGKSLLSKEDWYCQVVLPENFEKMEEYFRGRQGLPQPKRLN